MPKSFIIINDINLGANKDQVRFHFDPISHKIKEENSIRHEVKRHFSSSLGNYWHYGNEYRNNNIVVSPTEEISGRFNPWQECRSAQLVMFKEVSE